MITAKDIRKKKFEKIKFGYNPEEVDAFLAEVESDLRLMEQELADANNKVQLLADKIREYKASEEDLKNALIGAQKQAREVLAEANAKAAAIEEDAKAQASAMHAAAFDVHETVVVDHGIVCNSAGVDAHETVGIDCCVVSCTAG